MLTEEDPILRAFELSADLKELSLVEVEFRYNCFAIVKVNFLLHKETHKLTSSADRNSFMWCDFYLSYLSLT